MDGKMTRLVVLLFVLLLMLPLFVGGSVWAQTTASLTVHVISAEGIQVPDARVSLVNSVTGEEERLDERVVAREQGGERLVQASPGGQQETGWLGGVEGCDGVDEQVEGLLVKYENLAQGEFAEIERYLGFSLSRSAW